MPTRIFFFLLGFGLSVIGFVYIISYLNLMAIGYNFLEYVNFICRKFECLIAPIGLFITFLTIYIPKGEEDELHT
jgi:hypothetical protein